ncbi:MAG: hypothetical protein SPJ13_05610 [Bacteroidales bacterium]|nr:hypothetical protein [Bacteroidales bacterium]
MKVSTKKTLGQVRPGKQQRTKNASGTYTARYKDGVRIKASPAMPRVMYESEASQGNRSLFTLVQWHTRNHSWIFKRTFITRGSGNPATKYYSENKHILRAIFGAYLASLKDDEPVDMDMLEAAVMAYSVEHPNSIVIGKREGYETLYLNGEWPEHVVMRGLGHNQPIVVFRTTRQAKDAIDGQL